MNDENETKNLVQALELLRRASKLAALQFDDHVVLEQAYSLLKNKLSPPKAISDEKTPGV
jgi:hypothetical protein